MHHMNLRTLDPDYAGRSHTVRRNATWLRHLSFWANWVPTPSFGHSSAWNLCFAPNSLDNRIISYNTGSPLLRVHSATEFSAWFATSLCQGYVFAFFSLLACRITQKVVGKFWWKLLCVLLLLLLLMNVIAN